MKIKGKVFVLEIVWADISRNMQALNWVYMVVLEIVWADISRNFVDNQR